MRARTASATSQLDDHHACRHSNSGPERETTGPTAASLAELSFSGSKGSLHIGVGQYADEFPEILERTQLRFPVIQCTITGLLANIS